MPDESQSPLPETSDDRLPITRYLRVTGEAVLYFILVLSPWAFGGVDPEWQFVISLSVGVLSALWLARCIFYRRITIRPDSVTLGLGGLLCLTAIQLVPLPLAVVSVLSPTRAEMYRTLVPETLERIGDEALQGRPGMIPLSVDPGLTRHFLADLFLVLAVYLVARNWLATRGSIRRMAVVVAINGVALAGFAFAQYFTSQGKIFWLYPTPAAFGPFVCRNHYPFYAYLALGVAVGMLLNQAKNEYSTVTGKGLARAYQTLVAWMGNVSTSPSAVLLLAAAVVIGLSIPFSLSRGGLLALGAAGVFASVVAATSGGKNVGGGVLVAGLIAAIAIGLGAVLGWGPIERRLGDSLADAATADNRTELWKAALRVAGQYPVFGCGANAFQRVEPAVRTPVYDVNINTTTVNDSVHNEYLEALAEGGLLRLVFTLAIAISPLVSAVQAFRRLQSRSIGTIALGMAFGLFAVVVHSAFDFGIHLPAIALTAATFAAFARAAAVDPDFHPSKRTKTSGSDTVGIRDMSESQKVRIRSVSLIGPPAFAGTAVILIGMGLIVRQYRVWDRAERYATAATVIANSKDDSHDDDRIALAAARVGLAPDDAEAHAALSRAYFDVVKRTLEAKPHANWDEAVSPDLKARYVQPGLRAARAARAACDHFVTPHMRFAIYQKMLDSGDPAATYFARVKLLAPCDPEAWFASGVEAFERGEYKDAATDWKRSLALNSRQLVPIIQTASRRMAPEEIRDQFLPEDPAVLLAAANTLYPDRIAEKTKRQPYLARIKQIVERTTKPGVPALVALAQTEYETGNSPAAMVAWKRAVDLAPKNGLLRQQYAAWLEEEELYEPLVSELEWLRQNGYGGPKIADRIDVARHALDLKQIIDK